MNINHSLVRNAITVGIHEDVVNAAKLMRQHHIGFLVVIERRQGREIPIGVLTDRDLAIEVVAQDVSPRTIKVADIMVLRPLLATEEEDLEHLLARMRDAGVRRVPVVGAAGELRGMVSFDDILQAIAGLLNDMAHSTLRQRQLEPRLRA